MGVNVDSGGEAFDWEEAAEDIRALLAVVGGGGARVTVCANCGAEITPEMKFCSECGTRLDHGQSTASYAPAFEEGGAEVPPAAEVEGAALIELDQVEGTAGRRMHDIKEANRNRRART